MTAFARRLARVTRQFRRLVGPGAWTRWGMTFAEALVMIVVAGTLMIPVVGTLQTGVDRTTAYVHQDRMRTIAQASMTEILAGSAYERAPVYDFIATVTWPINDPEPVATYVMVVETLEGIALATLTSTIKGDFAGNEALLGTQPANLKTVVVTVTHIPDPGDTGAEPAQVRLFSMIATPKSFNPDRIYVTDKDNICLYAVDPLTKNVVETFELPYDKNFTKDKSQNDSNRPGNIAVHPNSVWVLIQRQKSLLLTDVALFSPTRRTSVVVYATSTTYLEKPNDNEAIRKDRGVAFRPDGRYCYVTSHKVSAERAGLSIYSVPETFNASFTFEKFLPTEKNKFTDLQVGEDGYLYLADYEYSSKYFRRLNMYVATAQAALEDFDVKPGKEPIAACTSRDGRDVYGVWKDGVVTAASSSNSIGWSSAVIATPTSLGEDLQDIQVSGNGSLAVITSKKGGDNTRIYGISLPFRPGSINPWTSPNKLANPKKEVTNQAVLSPALNEVWIDQKGDGEIYTLNPSEFLSGAYESAIPADKKITFLPKGDAGCVAARMAELVAVACDGPTKTIEFIDPWSKHHYANLSCKLPSSNTPAYLAYNGAGSHLSVCYNASSTLPTDIDVFNATMADIIPPFWGPISDSKPVQHVFFQNGGYLIQRYNSNIASNGYMAFDNAGSKSADVSFSSPTAILSDVIPLNDGGALVLVTDFVASWTRLDRIGSDAKLLAAWDSRFDNFPPNGATQMAISADDGLLVLYVPNSDSPGKGQLWQFFDMRTNNFGSLTQQKGFITDFRLSERSFAGAVPSAQKMTGTTFKLRDTFTCNASGTEANMASYPANFAYTTANKYAGNAGETRSSRFFGYLRIPTPVQTLGLWNRGASQVFVGAPPTSILGTILDPYTSGSSTTAPFSFSDAASRWIQLDHTSDNPQSDMALFYSPNSGETSATGTQDYTVNGVTALGPITAGWKRVSGEDTSPLRFTPQYLYSLQNHHNYSPNTNLRVFMCFSRDVASPTLYVFNAPYGGFGVQPFGGSLYCPSFSLPAYSAKGMAITPDGQRLVIAAANPNQIHLIDISTPATSTYMKEIGTIDLSQPPACITARPFNRIITRKDSYDVVATFTVEPPTGSNIAAVATNGIYLLGGIAANQTDPLTTILRFNPANNTFVQLPKNLAKKAGNPAVIAYDDELLVFNGTEVSPTGWVQKYNPTTGGFCTSIDAPPSPGTTLVDLWVNPNMTAANIPSPCIVSYTGSADAGEEGWKAFDGLAVSGNLWAPLSANQTVTFNFGSPSLKAIINSIQVNNVINPLTSGVKDFDFSGSHDGSTWTLLKSGTVSNNCNFSPSIDFSNSTPYQYYAFKAKTNQGGGLTYSSREIKLMYKGLRVVDPTMTSSILPSPYSVTAQSEVSGSGWKIFDGNTSTWWETSGVTNAWVRIDLVAPDIVDVVRVLGKSDALAETTKNFKIQASHDDSNWIDVSGTFVKPQYGDWNTFFFTNMTAYRYYRFVNESVQSGTQIKCPEVEFYSTQPPPPGILPPGLYMSQTLADDNSTVIARRNHAGCMTPYGPVFGGGFSPTNATSSVQIYWPHAVASGADTSGMPSSPIAWLKFDETSGTTAADTSGNGYNGTLDSMSAPGCWVAGRKNNCLDFDGVDDNVTISALTGNIVSVCFWMKEDVGAPTDWSGPFAQASNDTDGFQFRSSGAGYCPGYYSLKIGGTEYFTTIPATDQTWKHVALVKDGTTTKIYYNGVLNSTAAVTWTTAGAVRLGSNGNKDRWWNGKIDDLVIYGRVLTVDEIRKIAFTPPTPLLHLEFDETSGTAAADSSGNGYTATLSNFNVPGCWVAGKKNNCLDFIPTSNTVASVPDNAAWNLGGDFTICAWVNYDTFNTNWWEAAIVGHDEGGGSQKKWIFSYDPGTTKGTLFHIQDASGTGPTIKGNSWTAVPGTWYFLAVTKTGSTYQFYRDGVPDGTVTNAYTIPDAAAPLTIGKAEGAACFDGRIDDVRIYKNALALPEIQKVMGEAIICGISRELPSLPGPRVNHSLVWHKGKLYRVGGSDGTNILTTVDQYDPATNVWKELDSTDGFADPAALFKRQRAGACSFGDEIFIFGGENPAGARLSTAAAWNPATRSVRRLRDMPLQTTWGYSDMAFNSYTPLGINAVPLGPYIYLLGGSNGTANGTSKQVLRYTP